MPSVMARTRNVVPAETSLVAPAGAVGSVADAPQGGRAIGVISPYLAGPYYGVLLSSITQVAWQHGYRVVSAQTATPGMELQESTAARILGRVGWERLDGFVVIGSATPPGYLAALQGSGKPLVAIAHEEPGLSCPVVMTDNRGGIRQVVEHLIGHGHTRIAFAGCLGQLDTQERYSSYRQTLADHGTEPDPALFFEAPDNVEFGGVEAGRDMLAAGLPSTAVVAATDLNAVGIMTVLTEAGYVLPRDQAVTGFDNTLGGALLRPALSTVSQDFESLGAMAAELLLRQLAGEEVQGGCHLVPTVFVQRESCGCTIGAATVLPAELPEQPDLTTAFCRSLATGPSARSEGRMSRLLEVASQVAKLLQATGKRSLSTAELDMLSDGCEELCRLRPAQSTHELVLAYSERIAGRVLAGAGERKEVLAGRLDQCRAYVLLGLARASLGQRDQDYYALRKVVRDEYLITMDLLVGREEGDPRMLTWLERTDAVAGVFALWEGSKGADASAWGTGRGSWEALSRQAPLSRPEGLAPGSSRADGTAGRAPWGQPGSVLYLASTFEAGGGHLQLATSHCSPEHFPPDELLAKVTEGTMVAVVPVASDEADWGLLAMVAPVESTSMAQDMYFTWAALFAEVLDHAAVTSSLRQSEERYALAVRAANDGLWDWDLQSDRVYYSDRWKEMLGYGTGEVSDQPVEWLGRVHPDDRPSLLGELSELKLGVRDNVLIEHRLMAKDGSYIWALCRALAVPGGGLPARRLVGSLTDVTERHTLEDQLRHQALFDSLTGLPNRVLFVDRLSQSISNAKRRSGYGYAVLWLDLDNFKNLNDTRGHLAGDQLLVQVADRIRANLRETDTAARFGGDEFAVLLLDVAKLATVETIAKRLLEDLRAPYKVDGASLVVTGSVGVVMGTARYDKPQDVLRDADIAMYAAKSAGKGRLATFPPDGYVPAMPTTGRCADKPAGRGQVAALPKP
ncbi:MAG: diguanylate cyclase domain-containing protein [Acidimicrobiales bacterium]